MPPYSLAVATIARPAVQAAAAAYLCDHIEDAEHTLLGLVAQLENQLFQEGAHGEVSASLRLVAKASAPAFAHADFDQPTEFCDTVLRALRAWLTRAQADQANPVATPVQVTVLSATASEVTVTVRVPLF
jgi:hypothetical protein